MSRSSERQTAMTPDQAGQLAVYARTQCDWLVTSVVGSTVEIRLRWPLSQRRVIRTFRRSLVLAAIDELVAVSEASWEQAAAAARPSPSPRAFTREREEAV